MTFSVFLARAALALLVSISLFSLTGCLPSAQSRLDEEKEPHFLAGKTRLNAMDYQGAFESFEKALEANPGSASAHFELGCLCDQKESDPAARVAGMGMLAKALSDNPSPDLQAFFEQTAAPELVKASLNGQTPHERMAPVVALVRAGPYAVPAMQELAQNSPDPKIQDSARRFLAMAQPQPPK